MTPTPPNPDSPPGEDTLSRAQLRDRTFAGFRWIAAGRVGIETGALLSTLVVARLVSPAQFGLAAVAGFFFVMSSALPAGSFGSPLVQARVLTDRLVGTALTLSLVTGTVVTVAIAALYPAFSALFSPDAALLLVVAAPTFFFYSAGSVAQALLQRDLDFRRSSLTEVGALLAGTVVTVVAAIAGLDGLAIVIGFVAQSIVTTGLALAFKPPGVPRFGRAEAREILAFGTPTSVSNLLFVAQRNLGLLILSAQLSPQAVGLFWRANQLGTQYQGKISGILLRVLFPILARAASLEDVRAIRRRMVSVHAVSIFPLLTLLVVLAPAVVPFLFGDRWGDAALPAQILAVAGFATVVMTGTGPLLLAIRRPGLVLHINAWTLLAYLVALLVTSPFGLIAVCVGLAVVQLASLFAVQYFVVERATGISMVDTIFVEPRPAAIASLVMAATGLLARLGLEAVDAPRWTVIVVVTAVGATAYALTLRLAFPRSWRDIASLAGRLLPARLVSRLRPGRPAATS